MGLWDGANGLGLEGMFWVEGMICGQGRDRSGQGTGEPVHRRVDERRPGVGPGVAGRVLGALGAALPGGSFGLPDRHVPVAGASPRG